jgi:uncharacterized iron-regulated membrane protein
MRLFYALLPLVVLAVMLAMAITGASITGSQYRNHRKEIINRLWTEEDAPEEVSSEQISKRLIELNINVRER